MAIHVVVTIRKTSEPTWEFLLVVVEVVEVVPQQGTCSPNKGVSSRGEQIDEEVEGRVGWRYM